MKKLLLRLKSKKQSKKDSEKEKQRIYSKLTPAIDASLNDKSKLIESDLKMRRCLSTLSLRPKSDSVLSKRGSFAEKASKLTELEIAHLSRNQKRKIRSLNISSLKVEDLASLRNSINALEAILHPDEATRTLENNIRKSKRFTKDLRSLPLFNSKQKDVNQEESTCVMNSKLVEKKTEQEPVNQTENLKISYKDEIQEDEERAKRLQEKLAKLRKMEKQLEEGDETILNTIPVETKTVNQPQESDVDVHIKEIQHQQQVEHNIKEKELEEIQKGNIEFILSKLLQNDPGFNKLDLTSKNIGNANCRKLMQALHDNKTLCTLILRNNNLDNRCIQSVCDMLRTNTTLHTLDLSNNFITSPELIVESLQYNFYICNLELGRYTSEDTLDEMEEYLERNFNRREQKN